MALVNSAFTVNVTPGAMPPTVHVSEYDIGRTYTVTINGQNGSAFNIPTGTTATVEGTLNGVIGFTTGATISGSTVSFALTESMTARSGKAWCKIKLTLNGEPIQTCAFVLAVDRAGVEADTVIGASGFEQQIVDAVQDWHDEHPPAVGGMSEAFKQALLDCFENVAWINDQGQDYYDALYAALYPPVDVLSISAVFTQGSAVIYETDSLDTLKQYLTVTATYDDSSTGVVTNYTLSGTLTVGTSTITVSYGGKTTTFNVTVTEHPNTLDDIAYGTLTYRDIFVTNNKISYLGDFEGSGIVLRSNDYFPISGQYDCYRINAGSVSVSTDSSNTPSHSLKAFGSSSNQLVLNGFNGEAANTKYLCACAVKVTRYVQGKCGIQGGSPQSNITARFNIGKEAVTDGWEYFTDLCVFPSNQYFCYIGSWASANLDGYVDDIVVSPVPSEMTATEAQALYEEYIAIRLREGAST